MQQQDGGRVGAVVRLSEVTRVRQQGRRAVTVVDGVSLEIAAGETVALTGPSGSGKSSLLQLIGALEKPDSGSIHFDGIDLVALSRRTAAGYRQQMGFVFQQFHLLAHLSALDNVLVPVMTHRGAREHRERASDLLAAVGLLEQAQVSVRELSGGEQQRVAIARALINRPRLLLADEPTGSLDSQTGEEILDLLATVQAESGVTMIIATHDAAVAAQCSRQVSIRDGALVADRRLEPTDAETTLRKTLRPG